MKILNGMVNELYIRLSRNCRYYIISNFQVRLYNWGKRQATFVALREAPAASPAVPLGGILYQLPASCCPPALVAGELR